MAKYITLKKMILGCVRSPGKLSEEMDSLDPRGRQNHQE